MDSEQQQQPPAEIILGEDGKPLSEKALKKLKAKQEKEQKKKETADRLAAEKLAREAGADDYSKDKYGVLPMNQSQERTGRKRTKLAELNKSISGEVVLVSARVQKVNVTGKLCFLTLRQQFLTAQAVIFQDAKNTSKQMLKFASDLASETLVLIEATVVEPKEPVKSCTVQEVELKVAKLHVVSQSVPRLPFTLEDAARPEEDFEKDDSFVRVNLDTRLKHRVIDLRTITNQAIFRMQSGVCALFREFLEKKKFIEIHSPKLIGAASEGGSNVFTVSYFNRKAYLAQSPQLYKQMAICADFDRVYEIAPIFRAENSFTHRHMTEFVGLDLEMAFEEHYHEVLDLFDELFVFIFKGLETRFAEEIATVKRQYPFEDFLYLPKTLRLDFAEGIKMLREAGVDLDEFADINTEQEKLLGRLVREKYKTDFYFMDKFPLSVRPFYTMPDPSRPGYSNSYDFFMRGEEILSGAQRVHDAVMLETRAKEHGIAPETIQPYIDAFKYGAPPHAGGGIGLERVVMLYLKLGNIRRTSLFPRDPNRLEPPRKNATLIEPLVTLVSESPTTTTTSHSFNLEELDPLKFPGAAIAAEKAETLHTKKKGHFGIFDRLASGVAGSSVDLNPEREALVSKIIDLQESLRGIALCYMFEETHFELEQVLRTETARIEHRHLAEEDGILRKYIQNLMVNTRRFEA
ncbi:aspartate--tRNA ligase dps1 [Dinochytrium kinnereticum]|nr:aspartate--tRNA ligase dps1 [Dinochytrium kinnereticum]